MKSILTITLIAVLIITIATLSMILLIKETQHINEITKCVHAYNYQQERYLKNMGIFIKGYNELYDNYNELYIDHLELGIEKELCTGWEKCICTAYTSLDEGCNNISASGINIEKWSKYFNFCAVPPEYKLGTIFLVRIDGCIEPFLAVDRGAKIQIEEDGMNHIDLYFINDLSNAFEFGVRELEVKIIK